MIERDFYGRSPEEQKWLLEHTWCNSCNKADLGITNPREFEEGDVVYLEGECRQCGESIKSTIEEKTVDV